MNIFQRIAYFFMSQKEKSLSKKLNKHFETSATNSTSKTVISTAYTMTLNSVTQKNIELVKTTVTGMVKQFNYHPGKLLDFVIAKGTPVIKIKDATKKLAKIKLNQGFIGEITGLDAIYLGFITGLNMGMSTVPIIAIEDGKLETTFIIHEFYKWFSYYKGLPGFDKVSQELFRASLAGTLNMKSLTLKQMTGLREAINRDQEATDFALLIVREFEAAKKIQEHGEANM